MKTITEANDMAHFHRAYRTISAPGRKMLVPFISAILLLEAAVYLSIPKLTYVISAITKHLLAKLALSGNLDILKERFLFQDLYAVTLTGRYPTLELSVAVLVLCLLLLFVVTRSRLMKPLVIVLNLLFLINIASALFFIFIPSRFPYDLDVFSVLYLQTEVVTWLFIIVMMGLALYPLPASNWSKIAITAVTTAFAMIFCLIRYIAFLYIVSHWSYLFLALLYFTFGTMMDILYVIGFYSFYTSLLSRRISHDMAVWQWS